MGAFSYTARTLLIMCRWNMQAASAEEIRPFYRQKERCKHPLKNDASIAFEGVIVPGPENRGFLIAF
jgi:hypothetical protein